MAENMNLTEIDKLVLEHAVKNDTLEDTNFGEESNTSTGTSTSVIPKEVEEQCDDYNSILDYLIMTSDVTNLERITLYHDMIGIGFDSNKDRHVDVNRLLAKTVDFNKILEDGKPTNHIVKLNTDSGILGNICEGYSERNKIAYIFSLIPTLKKIKYLDKIYRRESFEDIINENLQNKVTEHVVINTNNFDEELDNLISENAVKIANEFYNGVNIKNITDTKKGFQCRKESAQSTRTDRQAKSPITYTKNSYTNENGVSIQYDEVTEKVDWTNQFKQDDSNEATIYNLEMIVEKFTKGLIKRIGGFDRFKEIVVTNNILIVNNVVYRPFADNSNMSTFLPADVVGAFSQGCYAPFFDWSYLLRCNNLRRLVIDTVEFAEDYIVPANNMPKLYSEWFFKYLKRLTYLKIGDFEFDKDKVQYEPETVKEKRTKAIETESGFFSKAKDYYQKSHFDYSRLAPTRLTDKLDNHFCGTFKDYVKNRGKKGLFRYMGGCLVRGILAGAATIINAGTHIVGDTAGYLSQYGPHIEKCEDRTGFTCYVGYKPNSRTQGESLGFTSGSSVRDNKSYNTRETVIKNTKKSTKKDKDTEDTNLEMEDE